MTDAGREDAAEDPAYVAWKAWHGYTDTIGEDCPDAVTCCDGFVAGWHAATAAHAERHASEVAAMERTARAYHDTHPHTASWEDCRVIPCQVAKDMLRAATRASAAEGEGA